MSNEIKISVSAIRVTQRPSMLDDDGFLNENDFFIFSLSSKILLQIAKFLARTESQKGVQRKHKEERDRQIGQFISSDHPFFPNTIIINVPLGFDNKYYNESNKNLSFKIPLKSAYIIDGQHRLKAFASKYSQGVELDLVVAAYFGLELPTIAEIFTRINYFQSPVSKSLVYDLLDFNKDPEFLKFQEAHYIASTVNSNLSSPFYGMIKMLGIGAGLISQAAFVEAITTRYKIIELLGNSYSKDDKIEVLESYFSAIKKSFSKKWGNKKSILTRSVGFNALVKVLREILLSNQNIDPSKIDYEQFTETMRAINVDLEEIKAFGGFKGVNTLVDKFTDLLKKKALL